MLRRVSRGLGLRRRGSSMFKYLVLAGGAFLIYKNWDKVKSMLKIGDNTKPTV